MVFFFKGAINCNCQSIAIIALPNTMFWGYGVPSLPSIPPPAAAPAAAAIQLVPVVVVLPAIIDAPLLIPSPPHAGGCRNAHPRRSPRPRPGGITAHPFPPPPWGGQERPLFSAHIPLAACTICSSSILLILAVIPALSIAALCCMPLPVRRWWCSIPDGARCSTYATLA